MAWLDRGLSGFEDTPLSVHARFDAIMTLLHYVRGEAHVAAVLLAGATGPAGEYEALLNQLVRPERFPALAAAIRDGVFAPDPADDGSQAFESGLAAILDGFELSMNR